jgi:tetratricopeptide (TPR) repeat protein
MFSLRLNAIKMATMINRGKAMRSYSRTASLLRAEEEKVTDWSRKLPPPIKRESDSSQYKGLNWRAIGVGVLSLAAGAGAYMLYENFQNVDSEALMIDALDMDSVQTSSFLADLIECETALENGNFKDDDARVALMERVLGNYYQLSLRAGREGAQRVLMRTPHRYLRIVATLHDKRTNDPWLHILPARVLAGCAGFQDARRKMLGHDVFGQLLPLLLRPRTGRGGFHGDALAAILELIEELLREPDAIAQLEHYQGVAKLLDALSKEREFERAQRSSPRPLNNVVGPMCNAVHAALGSISKADIEALALTSAERDSAVYALSMVASVQVAMAQRDARDVSLRTVSRALHMASIVAPRQCAPMQITIAKQLHDAHFLAEACEALRLALIAEPDDVEALWQLAQVLRMAGSSEDREEAVRVLDALRKLLLRSGDGASSAASPKSDVSLPRVLLELGKMHASLQRHEEAAETMRAALRADETLVDAHLALCHDALRRDDVREARRRATRALALAGDTSAAAHLAVGECAELSGDIEAALLSYRRAVACNAKSAKAARKLASTLSGAGQLDAALLAWRQFVELDPSRWYGYYEMAKIYRQRDGEFSVSKYRMLLAIAKCWQRELGADPNFFASRPHDRDVLDLVRVSVEAADTLLRNSDANIEPDLAYVVGQLQQTLQRVDNPNAPSDDPVDQLITERRNRKS